MWGGIQATARAMAAGDPHALGQGGFEVATVLLGAGITKLADAGRAADVARIGRVTKLYRAVKDPELGSITKRGVLRNPRGIEAKYFSTSPEGAAKYAKNAYSRLPHEGPYTLIEATIPTRVLSSKMRVSVDSGINTIVIPSQLLQ